MPVKRGIEIFAVAISNSRTHTKAKNPFQTCIKAVMKNSPQIFFSIVDIRQNQRQPDDGRNPALLHYFKRFISPLCGANISHDRCSFRFLRIEWIYILKVIFHLSTPLLTIRTILQYFAYPICTDYFTV